MITILEQFLIESLAFMQEVEVELYKLGIPAKTRHNEVAPGQFELAPIFGAANVATDNNQLVMAVLQSVAIKHGLFVFLHEKPFAGINGSGKHVNWSMSDSNGNNLLEPTSNPHSNYQFLAITAMIIEAINRHAVCLEQLSQVMVTTTDLVLTKLHHQLFQYS
jgi:glutamine synthetase